MCHPTWTILVRIAIVRLVFKLLSHLAPALRFQLGHRRLRWLDLIPRSYRSKAWNYAADALVKADPNRFEYVNTPSYWRGTDYVP